MATGVVLSTPRPRFGSNVSVAWLVSPRQVKLMDVSSSVVYENVPSNASSSLRNFASAFSALTTGRLRFSSISAVE